MIVVKQVWDGTDVDLKFELKKLKSKSESRLSYYSKDGRLRFVNGKCSPCKHLAFIAGMIVTDVNKCIKALKLAIGKSEIAVQLHLLKNPEGVYIHEPSR